MNSSRTYFIFLTFLKRFGQVFTAFCVQLTIIVVVFNKRTMTYNIFLKMKFKYFILTVGILSSCESNVDILNMRLEKDFLRKSRQINYYNNTISLNLISKSNFKNLFDIQRIKRDKNLIESKEILSTVNSILLNRKSENKKATLELSNLLDSFHLPYKIKNQEISKIKQSLEKTVIEFNSNFKSDSTILVLCNEFVDLLDGDCKFNISGDKLIFKDNFCTSKYNLLMFSLKLHLVQSSFNNK